MTLLPSLLDHTFKTVNLETFYPREDGIVLYYTEELRFAGDQHCVEFVERMIGRKSPAYGSKLLI